MVLRLLKLCFFLALYIHIFGCIWFFFNKLTGEQWIPAQFPAYEKSYNLTSGFYEIYWYEQYSISIYNAILQLCGNDIGPPNFTMIWVGIISLVMGAFMNANILGTIASVFQQMNHSSQKFHDRLDMVNTAMKNLKLPEEIQKSVRDFLFQT